MRWGSLLIQFYKLHKRLRKQQAFNRYWLLRYLNELEVTHQGTFVKRQQKKITEYYALFVPVIFCESYQLLSGQIFTKEQRRRATVLSIMTPLYDDFFDEAMMSRERIIAITSTPQTFTPDSFEEKVFCQLHLQLLQTAPSTTAYQQCFEKVLRSQMASLQQTDASITSNELMNITYQKSLDALRLFWTVLEPPPAWFDEVMYEAAGLLQLSNDLFDVYKDVQTRQYTPANRDSDFNELQQRFLTEAAVFNRNLMQLPYSLHQKKEFLFVLQAIIARGFVALQQLKKVWLKEGKHWQPSHLPREVLICDMQKPANFLRWLRYTHKFCNF